MCATSEPPRAVKKANADGGSSSNNCVVGAGNALSLCWADNEEVTFKALTEAEVMKNKITRTLNLIVILFFKWMDGVNGILDF